MKDIFNSNQEIIFYANEESPQSHKDMIKKLVELSNHNENNLDFPKIKANTSISISLEIQFLIQEIQQDINKKS